MSGVYEGDLVDRKAHGRGKCTYANGDLYEGDWVDGKQSGHGKMAYAAGDFEHYDGEWENGERHGNGTLKGSDGSVYKGELHSGKMHGKGKLTFEDGEFYDGEWKDDNMHGKGKYTYASGSVISVCEGEWKDGKMHGQGKETLANGDFYSGEWKDDVKHGKGKFAKSSGGGVYKGHWTNGAKHGFGILKEANGEEREQLYRKGRLVPHKPMQYYAERASTINIEHIASSANVEVLSRLRANDPSLLNLAVCDEGGEGRDSACYRSSSTEDLGWAGMFIGNNTNLQKLTLDRPIAGEQSGLLPVFFREVSRNRSLQAIELRDIELSNGDVPEPFLDNSANLHSVLVENCEFGGDGDRILSSMLRGCNSLEELRLENNLNDDEQPTRIIKALSTHAQLYLLSLTSMNVGTADCMSLVAHGCLSHLDSLTLTDNNIDDDGVEALMGAIGKGIKLHTLGLSHNPSITTRGVQCLAAAIENPDGNLERINFMWNGVNDEDANILARALPNSCKLDALKLVAIEGEWLVDRHGIEADDNLISAQGWRALSTALCNTSSILETYQSNHSLTTFSGCIGDGAGDGIPPSLAFSLEMNRRGAKEAARRKIITHHLADDEGMGIFDNVDRAVLPHFIAWVPRDELSLLYRFVQSRPEQLCAPASVEMVRGDGKKPTGGTSDGGREEDRSRRKRMWGEIIGCAGSHGTKVKHARKPEPVDQGATGDAVERVSDEAKNSSKKPSSNWTKEQVQSMKEALGKLNEDMDNAGYSEAEKQDVLADLEHELAALPDAGGGEGSNLSPQQLEEKARRIEAEKKKVMECIERGDRQVEKEKAKIQELKREIELLLKGSLPAEQEG